MPIFIDENPEGGDYLPRFLTDADVHPDFPAMVSYSTPSWNSNTAGGEYSPGWIAVHNFDSSFLHAHKLDITEKEELIAEYDSAQWHGTLGRVEVNVLEGMEPGTAEILWYSGIYGYGRYLYGTAEEPDRTGSDERPFEISVSVNEGNVTLTWPSREGQTFTVERSADLQQWFELSNDVLSGGNTTTLEVVNPGGGVEYYRTKRK